MTSTWITLWNILLPRAGFPTVSQSVFPQRHHSTDLHPQIFGLACSWTLYKWNHTVRTALCPGSSTQHPVCEIPSTRINFCPEIVYADIPWFIQIPFASLCTIINHSSKTAEYPTFPIIKQKEVKSGISWFRTVLFSPPWAPESLAEFLFYFILSYFILFYFTLFYFIFCRAFKAAVSRLLLPQRFDSFWLTVKTRHPHVVLMPREVEILT